MIDTPNRLFPTKYNHSIPFLWVMWYPNFEPLPHVAEAHGEVRWKKIGKIFKTKYLANYKRISPNHLIFPGKIQTNLN